MTLVENFFLQKPNKKLALQTYLAYLIQWGLGVVGEEVKNQSGKMILYLQMKDGNYINLAILGLHDEKWSLGQN